MKTLNYISFVGYIMMVAALLLLVFVEALFSPSPFVVALQILALSLMVWARITFGSRSFHYAPNPTEGGLVTNGPYRYLRHPIYASILYFALAGILANWSMTAVLCYGLLCLGAGLRILCEERLVIQQYPEYSAYAGRTKRIIPFVF